MTTETTLDTYIICSTPRTGSTLLCELLASTRIAGTPHSYFRSQDIERRASEWGLPPHCGFASYLDMVRRFTATPNGVLGLRVMWGTLDEILNELRLLKGDKNDLDLLTGGFGSLRFVHLERRDTIRQAISLYKAEETNYWHSTQSEKPNQPVDYNFQEIAQLVKSLKEDNAAWIRWFDSAGIEPLSVSYEDLETNPIKTAERVLRYLGLDPNCDTLNAPNVKLADETTDQWREKFVLEANTTS